MLHEGLRRSFLIHDIHVKTVSLHDLNSALRYAFLLTSFFSIPFELLKFVLLDRSRTGAKLLHAR